MGATERWRQCCDHHCLDADLEIIGRRARPDTRIRAWNPWTSLRLVARCHATDTRSWLHVASVRSRHGGTLHVVRDMPHSARRPACLAVRTKSESLAIPAPPEIWRSGVQVTALRMADFVRATCTWLRTRAGRPVSAARFCRSTLGGHMAPPRVTPILPTAVGGVCRGSAAFCPHPGHMAALDRSPPYSTRHHTIAIAHSAASPPPVIPAKHVCHMARLSPVPPRASPAP